MEDLLGTWEETVFGGEPTQCLLWPVCHALARALCSGRWPVDASPLAQRQKKPLRQAPALPSVRTQRCFLAEDVPQPHLSEHTQRVIANDGHRQARGEKRRRVSPTRLIRSLRSCRHVSSLENAESNVKDAVAFAFGDDAPGVVALQATRDNMPSRWTLCRGMIRFDVASMLVHREWSLTSTTFRYVGYDASPQRPGMEIFVTNERVVSAEDLDTWAPGAAWPNIHVRRLPFGCIGAGESGFGG